MVLLPTWRQLAWSGGHNLVAAWQEALQGRLVAMPVVSVLLVLSDLLQQAAKYLSVLPLLLVQGCPVQALMREQGLWVLLVIKLSAGSMLWQQGGRGHLCVEASTSSCDGTSFPEDRCLATCSTSYEFTTSRTCLWPSMQSQAHTYEHSKDAMLVLNKQSKWEQPNCAVLCLVHMCNQAEYIVLSRKSGE